jgi:hypothetical protein
MKRTLMQLGIGALEEMFASSKTDAKVLRQLENELQYRQVPRAVALLDQVQLAMKRVALLALQRGQEELPLEPPAAPAPVTAQPLPVLPSPTTTISAPAADHTPPSMPQPLRPLVPVPASQPRIERESIPAMSLEEACKLLKVTPGAAWQEVELSRRKLVLLSHPRQLVGMTPERQEAVRDDARRVNVAYAVLSASRAR